MVDSYEYGPDWWAESPMYRDDWFGSMNTWMAAGSDSKGVVSRGRFAALPQYYVSSDPQPADEYDTWDDRYGPARHGDGDRRRAAE